MLFKLISDGKQTWVELDGKKLDSAVTGVSFNTELDYDGKRKTSASIDLDLTKREYETRAFVDAKPGEFVDVVRRMEQCTDQLEQIKNAADEIKWQLYRAFDGTAGDIKPEEIIEDLNNRSKRIKEFNYMVSERIRAQDDN